MIRRLALLLALLLASPLAAAPLRVAAAADLRLVMADMAAAWRRAGGGEVAVTVASSGTLTAQILQGAPHDIFLSADAAYPQRLVAAGLTRGGPRDYALARLVLVAPAGGAVAVDPDFVGLKAALAEGRVRHIAIAAPATAPYGALAAEALTRAGVLPAARDRLVLGENVAQAMQFVATRAADVGVVSLALVRDPALAGRVTHAELPARWHAPLRQRLVVLKRAPPQAERFAAFVTGPRGRRILAAHGFGLP